MITIIIITIIEWISVIFQFSGFPVPMWRLQIEKNRFTFHDFWRMITWETYMFEMMIEYIKKNV